MTENKWINSIIHLIGVLLFTIIASFFLYLLIGLVSNLLALNEVNLTIEGYKQFVLNYSIYNIGKFKFTILHMSIIIGFLLYVLVYLIFTQNVNRAKKKVVKGDTHGDGSWASLEEIKKQYIPFVFPSDVKDLSGVLPSGWLAYYDKASNTHYIDPSTLSALTIAPARRNKTTALSIPEMIYNLITGSSIFVTDLKGEMLDYAYPLLKKLNYNVNVINLKEPKFSDKYNLIGSVSSYYDEYLKATDLFDKSEALASSQSEAMITAEKIIRSTKAEGTGDDHAFFLTSSIGALASIILLVVQFAPKEKRHFPSVLRLANDITSQSFEQNQLKIVLDMIDEIDRRNEARDKNIATLVAGGAGNAEGELLNNVISSLSNSIINFQDKSLLQIFSKYETNDFNSLVDNKSATFIIIPDNKAHISAIASLLIVQYVESLSNIADATKDVSNPLDIGKLKRQFRFILEEIGNVSKINKFDKYLSLYQGKNILFSLIFQDHAQINKVYGEDGKTLLNNADLKRFLGFASDDIELAERVSQAIGNISVLNVTKGKKQHTGFLDQTNNNTITENIIERRLITPEAVLQSKETLVLKSPLKPMKTEFVPHYKEAFKLNLQRSGYSGNKQDYVDMDVFTLEELKTILSSQLEDNELEAIEDENIAKIDESIQILRDLNISKVDREELSQLKLNDSISEEQRNTIIENQELINKSLKDGAIDLTTERKYDVEGNPFDQLSIK